MVDGVVLVLCWCWMMLVGIGYLWPARHVYFPFTRRCSAFNHLGRHKDWNSGVTRGKVWDFLFS